MNFAPFVAKCACLRSKLIRPLFATNGNVYFNLVMKKEWYVMLENSHANAT